MILSALFLTLDEYSSWRVGGIVPMFRSVVQTTLRILLRSDLVAELNQTVIEVQRTHSMMADSNYFSSTCGRLNFLSWQRRYNLCWAFFLYNGVCDCPTSGLDIWWCPGTWMTPLQSQGCSWWWVGGVQGSFSWSPWSSPLFWACWAPGYLDCYRFFQSILCQMYHILVT